MLMSSAHKSGFYKLFLSALICLISIGTFTLPAKAENNPNYVFLVDLSGSMAGESIEQAKKSLIEVLKSGEIKGRVSVVGFNTLAKTYYAPNENLDAAISTISQLSVGGNTALYDGIKVAVGIGRAEENATVITITDGKDTASISNIEDAAKLISQYDGKIYFLSISQDQQLLADLNYLIASNGKIINVADLSLLLSELKPLLPAFNQTLVVDKASSQNNIFNFKNIMLLFGLSLVMLLATLFYFYNERKSRKLKLKLLEAYDDEETKKRQATEKSIFFLALRFKPFNDYVKHEEKRLLAAGLSLDIRTWIYVQIAIFVATNLFLISNGFTPTLALIFSGFIGFGLGYLYLSSSRNRKAKAFAEELPDVLTIISSSLKSGLNFTQAIESVAKESDSEVALQFRRVLAEVQLGKPITDALTDVADRMDSTDFRWTISALSIQREVGGNLSEILSTTADTIRGRAEIRREIQALSAEGRMSAYVLVALPFFMMGYLQLTKPDSLKFMFSETIGKMLMVVFALLILVGWLWVRKVVAVKLS